MQSEIATTASPDHATEPHGGLSLFEKVVRVAVALLILGGLITASVMTYEKPPTPAERCVASGGAYVDVGPGLFAPAWECIYPPGVVPEGH